MTERVEKLALVVRARPLGLSLAGIVTALLVASVMGQLSKHFFGHPYLFGLVPLFNVNHEQSIPTWYSVMTLLLAAIVLFIIASSERQRANRFVRHWYGLGVIFVLLALDEGASFHEKIMFPLRAYLDTGGFLYYAWVIPAAFFVLIVGVVYLRFVIALPPTIRWQTILSGATFVSGALGVELFEAQHHVTTGLDFTYVVLCTIEEGMEMAGIALFIFAMVSFLEASGVTLRVDFGRQSAE